MSTIIEVVSQQPLTTEQINSFRSVPVGINLTSSGDGLSFLSNDGTYKSVTAGSSTNLSIANKTTTTFDVLSSTGTDVTLPAATITEAGLLTATNLVKLNSLAVQVNADWNSVSGLSQILNKPSVFPSNISNVSGLQTALDGKFNNPTGDTTQYLAGDGSLIAFPVAGQAGTLVRQIRNETGSTLTKGTVVYISGASGNKPLVTKALATSDATSAQTFGIIQADVPTNQNGYVVGRGDLIGLDTSAFLDGTQLYLSGTVAGTVTSTKPVAPIHMVYVGVVTRSHATQGQIEVAIQNGYELDELHDVLIVSKTNKDVLSYETASGLWKNKQLDSTCITDFNTATDARVAAGITGKQPLDNDLTAIAALAGTAGFLKKTAVDTWSLDTNSYYLASNPSGYTTNIGTVTTASVVNANGFAGTVATATTTPAITISTTITGLLKGNGTAISAATAGTDYLTPTGSAASLTGLTSTQVTTALGFTPYNATNPSGYTSNVGTVTTASIVTANGFSGSVANATTTPAITISLQNATTSQSGQLTSTDWNTFNGKQAALVSGTNIKTVNGNSLLGSGDITVSGGGVTITEVEVDFGSKPVRSKRFTITNASINGTSKIIVTPSGNPATGRGSDDWEWDQINAVAKAGSGSFVMTCASATMVKGKRKFFYTYS